MLNKLALTAAAAAAILGFSSEAHAAPSWHLSPPVGNVNGFCNGTGIMTQVGYYGEQAPRVGHTQDAALVVVVQNGCGSVTAIPSFVLPSHIVQDTDQAVECTHVSASGVRTAITDPAFCNTHPIPNNLNLDDVHGWRNLGPGERLEVYMPVLWLSPGTTQFTSVVNNNFGPLGPTIQFGIAPETTFDSFSVNQGSSTTASFVIRNADVGSAVIEYGTSTAYQYATAAQTTTGGTQAMTFTLANLQPSTTYHYRVRFLVPFLGAYWSDDQTFTTPMAEIVNPFPRPPIFCRRYCY